LAPQPASGSSKKRAKAASTSGTTAATSHSPAIFAALAAA
jgi:hypothetical protein